MARAHEELFFKNLKDKVLGQMKEMLTKPINEVELFFAL